MDWDVDVSERALWRPCLPDWAISLFLAPFADEVGYLRATLAHSVRCVVLAGVVAAILPEDLLEPVAAGALVGGAAVMLLAAFMTEDFR